MEPTGKKNIFLKTSVFDKDNFRKTALFVEIVIGQIIA